MSLEEKFTAACDQARKFSRKPPDAEMLEIYALYKQSTVGDCNTAKPGEATGKAKWEAWKSKRGLDANSAKEQYVEKIKNLAPTYA